jgi:hypothetical protein
LLSRIGKLSQKLRCGREATPQSAFARLARFGHTTESKRNQSHPKHAEKQTRSSKPMPVRDCHVDADTEKTCYNASIERNESRGLLQTESERKSACHSLGPHLGMPGRAKAAGRHRCQECCRVLPRMNLHLDGASKGCMLVHQLFTRGLPRESSCSASSQNCRPSPAGFPAASHF